MKRGLILIIVLFLTSILFGCKSKDIDSSDYGKIILNDKDEISYLVDQIVLSKSFQSTEPSIEVTSKKDTTKVFVSLGLGEVSGINVEKLVKRGDEVDIHVSGIYDGVDLQLVVPQVTLEIKQSRFKNIKDLKFNIVNEDYTPLKIKLDVNEVLSIIQSHFKVSGNSTPLVNLTRVDDDILWEISYNSMFDREDPQIPLINLSASIDANSGEIIDSEKTFISSSIDDGHVLDYKSNDFLLYRKQVLNGEDEKVQSQLWSYDLSSQEKIMVFSSNLKIQSAKYSPDLSYISLIETSDKGSELYIIPRDDKKAYKIFFEDVFNPKIMSWQDDNNLYLIENINKGSIIFSYEVDKNITNKVAHINQEVHSLSIQGDMFLITEDLENSYNDKISTTLDWKDFNFIDNGFIPKFIGRDKLGYLKQDMKEDSNSLYLYSIRDEKNINIIKENISIFQVLSSEDISYIKNNPNHNDFTLLKYSLEDQDSFDIKTLVSDKVYYDSQRDYIYANITLPFENDRLEMIYLIDLNN